MRCASIAACLCALGACSTYEVYDAYTSQETGKEYLSFDAEGGHASIGFARDDARFFSVGVLGAPVIPVGGRTAPETSMLLEVNLTLRRRAEFLFSPPCLVTSISELCPQYVRVHAFIRSADNFEIEGFRGKDALFLSLPRPEGKNRITDRDIFEHYGYRGTPEWTSATVHVTYGYVCAPECPTELSLSADDVVAAGEAVRTRGEYHFQKRRVRDYEAVRGVQE